MSADLFTLDLDDEPAALAIVPLALDDPPAVEVLPPGFEIPALAVFAPNVALRRAVDGCTAAVLAVDVAAPGGLALADAAVLDLRGAVKAIEAHFEAPKAEANARHKRLTSLLGEWTKHPTEALATVGRRMIDEQSRLATVAAAAARAAQAQADAAAKAQAQAATQAAVSAGASAAVVEQLQQRAQTATAPPVAAAIPAPLKSTGTAKTWKARLSGTPAEAEPNPEIEDLTDAQRLGVLQLCKGITDGKIPISAIGSLNWSYLNKRADAERTAFAIAGFEAFEHVAPKAKPASRR